MADFKQIKETVAIDKVAHMLGLTMKKSGPQLRSACPTCKNGGDRALAITVDRGSYYCFAERKGGDCIALACHILGITPRDAGEQIAKHFGLDSSSTTPPAPQKEAATPPARGMAALEDLDPLAPEVEALGISPSTADILGIGYRDRGVLGAGVYLPLRTADGTLVGYMRVNLDDELPFRFPPNLEDRAEGKVVPLRRKA